MSVAILKYNAGNVQSVLFAMKRLGTEAIVTNDHAALRAASHVIIPGVGEAGSAMAYFKEHGLDTLFPTLKQPVLGICLGLQVMCSHSEEADTPCLGIFPNRVRLFRPGSRGGDLSAAEASEAAAGATASSTAGAAAEVATAGSLSRPSPEKVPQIGWNTVSHEATGLFEGIDSPSYMYYVHSYYAEPGAYQVATTNYITPFAAALVRDNFYAVQFHPEKSADAGERLLKNFLSKR